VAHNTLRRGQYQKPEVSSRQVFTFPRFQVLRLHKEPWLYHPAFVDPVQELHPELTLAPIVDELEGTEVPFLRRQSNKGCSASCRYLGLRDVNYKV